MSTELAAALEQPFAGDLLEPLELQADGRLRPPDGFRRAGEVAVRGNRHEGAQKVDFEITLHGFD
jgi:hypothetical protein